MAWSSYHSFQSFVHQVWNREIGLEPNKTRMAQALSSWNKDVFGNIFQRKKRVMARLCGVQYRLAEYCRSDLLKLDCKLRKEMEEILYQEELLWFQRSREEWIVSRDRNTHFYHVATSVKNNSLKVKLKDDLGNWITDVTAIQDHIRYYFVEFFKANPTLTTVLPRGCFPPIHNDVDVKLISRSPKRKLSRFFFDMAPCKAPGPDGFNAGFYQQAWQTVGDSIIAFA
ncbi:PREDICTED: uncharacterized protein LOC109185205 [Ipomoea nil]|uniref:uncharacterized protein LOC109185205 n=1 Tax=Ipomoea nil TaxID=35883 RepID=UPI000900B37D|nr:PREDICTED: uncharacterized protein LOC109185205 [Ipomoea nil]